jgi:hypothetical protein
MDSPHPARELLVAIAERLARDVDEATEVRDRIAASTMILKLVDALDVAILPPRRPGAPGDDEGADPGPDGGDDDDDPFDIGDMPPVVGDAPAS